MRKRGGKSGSRQQRENKEQFLFSLFHACPTMTPPARPRFKDETAAIRFYNLFRPLFRMAAIEIPLRLSTVSQQVIMTVLQFSTVLCLIPLLSLSVMRAKNLFSALQLHFPIAFMTPQPVLSFLSSSSLEAARYSCSEEEPTIDSRPTTERPTCTGRSSLGFGSSLSAASAAAASDHIILWS